MTDNYDIIKDFLTPTEIVVEESGPTRSKIVLEPLEQGFGPQTWQVNLGRHKVTASKSQNLAGKSRQA